MKVVESGENETFCKTVPSDLSIFEVTVLSLYFEVIVPLRLKYEPCFKTPEGNSAPEIFILESVSFDFFTSKLIFSRVTLYPL